MHRVLQRCGLLLQMFRGLCVSVGHNHEIAEPIEMPFGTWTQVGPRNHVGLLGGGPGIQEKGQFWGRPLRCSLSSKLFYHFLKSSSLTLKVDNIITRKPSLEWQWPPPVIVNVDPRPRPLNLTYALSRQTSLSNIYFKDHLIETLHTHKRRTDCFTSTTVHKRVR